LLLDVDIVSIKVITVNRSYRLLGESNRSSMFHEIAPESMAIGDEIVGHLQLPAAETSQLDDPSSSSSVLHCTSHATLHAMTA